MTDIEQAIEGQQSQQTDEARVAEQAPASAGSSSEAEAGREDVAASAGEAAPDEALQGDVAELVAVAAQRDEYLALAQRTQADFENYRKRVSRESALAAERGVGKLAKELLPALDNFDRALEAAALAGSAPTDGGIEEPAAGAGPSEDALLQGVRLVRSELGAALARAGIESFSPVGEPFDPAEHEAMAQRPVEDTESGTVVEVYQPGYRLNGTVLRPARVLVAA